MKTELCPGNNHDFSVGHMTKILSEEETISQMYRSVGMAVFACQTLELTFVLCVKLVFQQNHVHELQYIDSLNSNSFRTPTKALLKELAKYIEIDYHFSDTLSDIVDRRHELIHRWGLKNKIPVMGDIVGNKKLIEFSNKLALDASGVSTILISYICAWLKRFPAMRDTLEKLSDETLPLSERFPGLKIQKA
jgi:hypothetical protein